MSIADDHEPERRLANDYVEMVELFNRGAIAEAKAVHERIIARLERLITQRHASATAALADGRPFIALERLRNVLEVHRWNYLQLPLPIPIAGAFEDTARILTQLGQPVAAAAARAMAASGGKAFYQPHNSCQIAILGALYERQFGTRADGSFVEIGAFDGEMFSNTSCLADLGWRGVYVEPVPGSAERCRQRHQGNPKVSVLNCAVGAEDGTAQLWVAGQFTTGSSDSLERAAAHQWLDTARTQQIEVPQLRLDSVLRQAAIAPGFELLVVDVEGMEEAVFAGIDLAHWRPRCMIVELVDDAASDGAAQRLMAAIRGHGYEVLYYDGNNAMFALPEPA